MPKTALVIGATGATGKDLVEVLLADQDYTSVTIFVRKPTGRQHPKLTEQVVDFTIPASYAESVTGDVLFSCLGTTLKAAGSKENQWKIDVDIPLQFATLAKNRGVASLVLVSAYGASARSRVFYSRMKGVLEEKLAVLGFVQYIIFRPGALERAGTDRLGEKLAVGALKMFNTIGLLRKYRPLSTRVLAEKLARAPKVFPEGQSTVSLEKIFAF